MKKKVPKVPSLWDEFKDFFNYEVEHKGGVLNVLLLKNEEGRIHIGALFLVYGMPILSVYVFYLIMKHSFAVDGTEVARTKRLETENAINNGEDTWFGKT